MGDDPIRSVTDISSCFSKNFHHSRIIVYKFTHFSLMKPYFFSHFLLQSPWRFTCGMSMSAGQRQPGSCPMWNEEFHEPAKYGVIVLPSFHSDPWAPDPYLWGWKRDERKQINLKTSWAVEELRGKSWNAQHSHSWGPWTGGLRGQQVLPQVLSAC